MLSTFGSWYFDYIELGNRIPIWKLIGAGVVIIVAVFSLFAVAYYWYRIRSEEKTSVA